MNKVDTGTPEGQLRLAYVLRHLSPDQLNNWAAFRYAFTYWVLFDSREVIWTHRRLMERTAEEWRRE